MIYRPLASSPLTMPTPPVCRKASPLKRAARLLLTAGQLLKKPTVSDYLLWVLRPVMTEPKALKIVIIAGETSGDLLGAKLMKALRLLLLPVAPEFSGIGGEQMERQGMRSLFPMQELSLMGFIEILPHLPRLFRRIHQTVKFIRSQKPDAVITIDSPGFCFQVAKKLKHRHFP